MGEVGFSPPHPFRVDEAVKVWVAWFAKGINPITGQYEEHRDKYYDDITIYFAIKIGWDDNE